MYRRVISPRALAGRVSNRIPIRGTGRSGLYVPYSASDTQLQLARTTGDRPRWTAGRGRSTWQFQDSGGENSKDPSARGRGGAGAMASRIQVRRRSCCAMRCVELAEWQSTSTHRPSSSPPTAASPPRRPFFLSPSSGRVEDGFSSKNAPEISDHTFGRDDRPHWQNRVVRASECTCVDRGERSRALSWGDRDETV